MPKSFLIRKRAPPKVSTDAELRQMTPPASDNHISNESNQSEQRCHADAKQPLLGTATIDKLEQNNNINITTVLSECYPNHTGRPGDKFFYVGGSDVGVEHEYISTNKRNAVGNLNLRAKEEQLREKDIQYRSEIQKLDNDVQSSVVKSYRRDSPNIKTNLVKDSRKTPLIRDSNSIKYGAAQVKMVSFRETVTSLSSALTTPSETVFYSKSKHISPSCKRIRISTEDILDLRSSGSTSPFASSTQLLSSSFKSPSSNSELSEILSHIDLAVVNAQSAQSLSPSVVPKSPTETPNVSSSLLLLSSANVKQLKTTPSPLLSSPNSSSSSSTTSLSSCNFSSAEAQSVPPVRFSSPVAGTACSTTSSTRNTIWSPVSDLTNSDKRATTPQGDRNEENFSKNTTNILHTNLQRFHQSPMRTTMSKDQCSQHREISRIPSSDSYNHYIPQPYPPFSRHPLLTNFPPNDPTSSLLNFLHQPLGQSGPFLHAYEKYYRYKQKHSDSNNRMDFPNSPVYNFSGNFPVKPSPEFPGIFPLSPISPGPRSRSAGESSPGSSTSDGVDYSRGSKSEAGGPENPGEADLYPLNPRRRQNSSSSSSSSRKYNGFQDGITVGYTYDAFFISDGRARRRNQAREQGKPALPACPPTQQQRYKCSECGKHYATSSNLSRHKQTHRSLESQQAKPCPHCGKVYVSMPALSMHILTHDLKYRCTVCSKAFSRPWLLQGHLRSHSGEKPYGCKHCGRAFADRSNLRAHMQTHSAYKLYTCQKCFKSFALKAYLNKHLESSCVKDDEDGDVLDTDNSDATWRV